MAPSAHYYRIKNVPISWPKSTLLTALKTAYAAFDTLPDTSLSLYPAPSEGSQTALLKYNGALSVLDQTGVYRVNGQGYALEIDNHFQGLTQLNAGGENARYDIIAVGGVDGHAYNTWLEPESGKMWLRDFIPLRPTLANSRVMTYGYDTRLVSGKSWVDYRKEFLQELVKARTGSKAQTRPIIFIGHNIGGIMVVQALLECLANSAYRQILSSVKNIVFLGTPHQGMQIEALITSTQKSTLTAAQKTTRTAMLQQLAIGSPFLKKMAVDATNILKSIAVGIGYETRGVLKNGWEVYMVDRSSAMVHNQGWIVGFVAKNNEDLVKFSYWTEPDLATIMDFMEL
ncbi:uncharacterized protein H6S33_004481 [Morchella sextelata]|uniref:uncharacterized protein n=1 Tax=Morchella sextelata TaxID=1174677 RepID=UPI001D03D6CA|nr:uncharacterized protein H6S33_004481 [Morchella sextelata]KAH0606024.1 hypothetical protein H6S33_004481 [Morchella sextelata]